MNRIGSQRKYKCDESDFPICLCITAREMNSFQGVLSEAIVKKPNDPNIIKTFPMSLEGDGLVRTSTVSWPNYTPEVEVRITFTGSFETASNDANPQYEIKLIAASGCEAVTKLKRPQRDPAVAHLIFQT